MTYTFRWKCSWWVGAEFQVYGDGSPYRVELRSRATDWEREHFHINDDHWYNDIVPSVGILRRSAESWLPLKPEVVAAFNAWRLAEHAEFIAKLRAHPERYGTIADYDPIIAAPSLARGGGHYVIGTGWIVTEAAP